RLGGLARRDPLARGRSDRRGQLRRLRAPRARRRRRTGHDLARAIRGGRDRDRQLTTRSTQSAEPAQNHAAWRRALGTGVYERLVPSSRVMQLKSLLAPCFILALTPTLALAAPPPDDPDVPAGTTGQADASSGKTELGTGDKFVGSKE